MNNLPAFFIHRPVTTTLLTLAIMLSGILSFILLPVAPLPQVDFPVIMVQASFPGASPEVMASTVATPLERTLGKIAGVSEMTSVSSQGNTRVSVVFDMNRDINGAARDVQAAINASRSMLPSGMPKLPTYRKANPADSPIMVLALTSDTMRQGQLYDAASTILAQKISQVEGVGQVTLGGSALPGVRIEVNLDALNQYGIGLEDVRSTIAAANTNRPRGMLENDDQRWQIYTNEQLTTAADYMPLVITYNNGAAVRISDIGIAKDSVQDLRNAGLSNGKQAVILLVFKQPSSNIIETVERVNEMLPKLRAAIPAAISLDVMMDRTPAIRSSLREVEHTLVLSVVLVIFVVFMFLANPRASIIPCVAVPISLLGTFGIMYLCDFSLNALSLMALTVATGFVVDDAIVVLENSYRHLEAGDSPHEAATKGARDVFFTVISMTISLIAVFVPILFMGGIVGRIFSEFAVTLSAAVAVSLVVSLTLTPMMCAHYMREGEQHSKNRFLVAFQRMFEWLQFHYGRTLQFALRHARMMMLLLFATMAFNVYLYIQVPKGLFPQQDMGRMMGNIQADQDISFQLMKKHLDHFMAIIREDPAVQNVVGFTGGNGNRNSGNFFITLKSWSERGKLTTDEVVARLRGKTGGIPGAKLFLQSAQDIRVGGRQGNAQYQYTLQAPELDVLREWTPKLVEEFKKIPFLADVNTDQQDRGAEYFLEYDRDTMARYGITPSLVNNTLSDAFSQRQVSIIYNPLNQYNVVLVATEPYLQNQDGLKSIYVKSASGEMVPLSAFSDIQPAATALAVNHQGQFAAGTISFNLAPGKSLGEAKTAVDEVFRKLNPPASLQGGFQGTAKVFQESLDNQPMLILGALLTIYIVLGMLYESYLHPLTILSTLPSAGVGAILALMLCKIDFTLIALIGVLLLIGIVKKNAILMIDFAIHAEHKENLSPQDAIYRACMLRFRPIMMTTMAALFGALPLALGFGEGADIRQPLGVTIVGGLIVSQVLTLYTTPVVYLALDNMRIRWMQRKEQRSVAHAL